MISLLCGVENRKETNEQRKLNKNKLPDTDDRWAAPEEKGEEGEDTAGSGAPLCADRRRLDFGVSAL